MNAHTTTKRVTAIAGSLLLCACAQTGGLSKGADGIYEGEMEAYLLDKPEELHEQYEQLFRDGVRNAVLNQMRIGLAAMELGYFDEAEASFEGALQRIERVYSQDRKADLAKSKFEQENIKDFKGEPYERAMAYMYRGLLYLRRGDYQNARATFLSGEFQDSVSETETFQGDFAVLNYLAGWASQCDGDDQLANSFYQRAQEHNPRLLRPGYDDNVLLIAGIGNGPTKVGTGSHKEVLEFRRGTGFSETKARFSVPGAGVVNATPATDVYWQASTRGGRPIEAILNGKAKFKDATAAGAEISGAVANQLIYQAALEGNTDYANYGAAIAAVGVVFDIFSSKTVPAADTRHWDNLPNTIAVGTTQVSGDIGPVNASFSGESGSFVRPAYMQAQAGSCSVAWSRSQSASDISSIAPGSQLTNKQKRKLRKTAAVETRAFHAELMSAN